ncbi:unnamed protein product [Arabis nemorensis]|uniref:Uncharacterized protein n=1 Tax=Arabis nemorensis TaxID=586526 RepID=A0A565AVQ3_9BRAS|nr:unnamed protein product [Arabis nemorensis]
MAKMKMQFYAIVFLVIITMTKVLAEESPMLAEEPPAKVTAKEVTLAAEAAASSFKTSAGEAVEGAKTWADWATSTIR